MAVFDEISNVQNSYQACSQCTKMTKYMLKNKNSEIQSFDDTSNRQSCEKEDPRYTQFLSQVYHMSDKITFLANALVIYVVCLVILCFYNKSQLKYNISSNTTECKRSLIFDTMPLYINNIILCFFLQ